jgi:alpha-glucosidase
LAWFKELIELRRTNPALHSGKMVMLDTANTSVLSYERTTENGAAVVVAMNFTAQPETISLDVPGAVKTLATDDAALKSATSLKNVTLAPYASWIVSVQ